MDNIKSDNHFIPEMYLKNWADKGKLPVYRTLVQHENVPLWKDFHLKGIGYLKYLYVDTASGFECDKLEDWFSNNYEIPADKAISKVIANEKLTSLDCQNLINFVALQDLRTPTSYIKHLQNSKSDRDFSGMVERVVKDIESKIPANFEPSSVPCYHDSLPLKIFITKKDLELSVQAEMLVGRGSWLWSIQHLLNGVSSELHKNQWSILHPAKNMKWLTSDNPVVKLNYSNPDEYDLKGGWRSQGTDIFLPLSPRHLLHTQVGKQPVPSSLPLSISQTEFINQMIIDNSRRYVFSDIKQHNIHDLHTRVVSQEKCKNERLKWDEWHEHQRKADMAFYRDKYA
ncbi:DUF4238 domain-containing protein [Psychromonas sp.]|uniref:DUF4238 domain-containing protein n=1 Tax=Psychromonas sp. TaxID=1884585 RepID=UPI003A969808